MMSTNSSGYRQADYSNIGSHCDSVDKQVTGSFIVASFIDNHHSEYCYYYYYYYCCSEISSTILILLQLNVVAD